jgi:hypothetical protein
VQPSSILADKWTLKQVQGDGACIANGVSFTNYSNIKPEQHDVAVLDQIVLAL